MAPIDLVVGAPLVVRALLGVTPLGRVVQGAVLGAYLASAVRDWHDRRGIRKIDFRREFGADLRHPVPMPREIREAEVRTLARRLNDEFVPQRRPRRELAVEVDRHLTRYIASITGQRVRTSAEVRGFALSKLAFPFALGACDALSGDVAIFKDTGPLEPHVLAHEFSHRKGYWKELPAQVLAYLALIASGRARPAAGRPARALLSPPARAGGQGERRVRAPRRGRARSVPSWGRCSASYGRPRPRSAARSKPGCGRSTTRACG